MASTGNGYKLNVKKTACLLVAATLCAGTTAWAAKPNTDEFHSNAGSNVKLNPAPAPRPIPKTVDENPVAQAGALSIGQDHLVKRWFDGLDGVISTNLRTSEESAILAKPLNKDPRRVADWTETASKVSGRYKLLAKKLRGTPVPPGCPGLDTYLEMNADWFDDSAEVYDELMKPRPPAKTQEELDEQLLAVKTKAQALKNSKDQLRSYDTDMRKAYKVPMARHEDALRSYIEGLLK
jgi:hypothetical protein